MERGCSAAVRRWPATLGRGRTADGKLSTSARSVAELGAGPAMTSASCEPVRASRMVIGLPAYFYPGTPWSRVVAGAPPVRYVIANPSSGPGLSPDPAYTTVVAASRAAGVEVFGYVSTRWGARPLEEVLQEIERYRDWYGIASIFFDEAATAKIGLPYYRRLSLAVRRTAGARSALNPGCVPDERYAELADLLVVFEGSYSAYRTWAPPQWQDRYPRERFWHLVYAAPRGRVSAALETAERRSAGVVYVTDAELDNPWRRLPSYWLEALETVVALNR